MIDLFSSVLLALPAVIKLLSIVPLFIGALLLPKLFKLPRLLILIGAVLLALTVFQYLIVTQIAAGGFDTDSQDITNRILQISTFFMVVGFVGMVLLGSGIWILASELRKSVGASGDEAGNT